MSRKDKKTVIILMNVGVTVHNDPDTQFINRAKQFVERVITRKIFVAKDDEVGIILMGKRSAGTGRPLIHVFQPVQVCSFTMVERVRTIDAENCHFVQWMDGLFAALQLMENDVYDSKETTITVLSDCYEFAPNEIRMQKIINGITNRSVKLLWIGKKDLNNIPADELSDCDKIYRQFFQSARGTYFTFNDPLTQMPFYGVKKPKPSATSITLEIADIAIPVKVYVYVQDEKPIKFTKVAEDPEDQGTVKVVSKNTVLFDRKKEQHALADSIKGVLYGKKIIPVPDDDEAEMKNNKTKRCFTLRGFVKRGEMKLEYRSGKDTHIILPGDGADDRFFALVEAMTELDYVAIVRKVHCAGQAPSLKVVYPQLRKPGEPTCLFMYTLAFQDDFCQVDKQPYEKILNSVNDEQLQSVDELIDSMMLPIDDPQGSFEAGVIHNPDTQYLYDILSHRAVDRSAPKDYEFPPRSDALTRLLMRPEILNNARVQECIDKVTKLFDLNVVPKKEEEDEEQNAASANPIPDDQPACSTSGQANNQAEDAVMKDLWPPIDEDLDKIFAD